MRSCPAELGVSLVGITGGRIPGEERIAMLPAGGIVSVAGIVERIAGTVGVERFVWAGMERGFMNERFPPVGVEFTPRAAGVIFPLGVFSTMVFVLGKVSTAGRYGRGRINIPGPSTGVLFRGGGSRLVGRRVLVAFFVIFVVDGLAIGVVEVSAFFAAFNGKGWRGRQQGLVFLGVLDGLGPAFLGKFKRLHTDGTSPPG